MTVRELIKHIENSLLTDEGLIEAKISVMHYLDIDSTSLLMRMNDTVDEDIVNKCNALIERRNKGYPLYYILGKTEFYGLPFCVGEGVLIPRQDTEVLVDEAIDYLSKLKQKENLQVLDLCAGTGCVGISIAKNVENAVVTQVELFDKAYDYLVENIRLNNCSDVTPIKADAKEYIGDEIYDLVVSNPPYVNYSLYGTLQKEVMHEPETALFAEDNGLLFYKIFAKNFKGRTSAIMFEIGEEQSSSVSNILIENGFENIRIVEDTNGHTRVCIGYYCVR